MPLDYKKVLPERFYPILFRSVRCNFRERVKIGIFVAILKSNVVVRNSNIVVK